MSARVRDLFEMIKFSHTVFALPFALFGAALAAKLPEGGLRGRARDWIGILLAMATARAAAMAFNRIVDRAIDAENPRTATRQLPTGRVSLATASIFTTVASIGFLASTLLFLPNRLPLYLAAPVLAWLFMYSYTKRFTSLAHFWLGASLMAAPIAAWIALRGDIAAPPVLLGLAVFCWVSGFDIIYACQDVDFDRSKGLRSVPARIGVSRALRLAAGCHAAMIALLIALGRTYPLGAIYLAGVAAIAILLVHEHAIVAPDDLSRVNYAFFHVNAAISVGLLVVGIADLAWPIKI